MPDQKIKRTVLLPSDKTYYIVGFEPLVSTEVAHHLVLRACPTVTRSQTCSGGDTPYVYAWARGAPPLYLPSGVGFKFGRGSSTAGIQLAIHFKDISHLAGVDKSNLGVRIHYTELPQPKQAGIFQLTGSGRVGPKTTKTLDVACEVEDDVTMNIFAYRTHSHQLGKVISGYVVRSSSPKNLEWTLVGKKDPQLPQFFYPTTHEVVAQKGDILAARCTVYNFKNIPVRTGPTNDDMMCNFYLMYWVDNNKFPIASTCHVNSRYAWETDWRLSNIPEDSDTL